MKKSSIASLFALSVVFACAAAQAGEWNYAAYVSAMKESGRSTNISEKDWQQIQ